MPENNDVPKWDYPGKLYLSELPMTKIQDELSAVKVTLVSAPERDLLYKLFKNVALVSWGKSWKDMDESESVEFLETVLSGGMLPLAMEMNNFTFLIEGISRFTTHALVRTRVGATYAQMSTGNADQRHSDILIPRSFSTQNAKLFDTYVEFVLDSKQKYSDAVDAEMSVQEARIFLPVTNSNSIYLSMNLAALVGFYSKRMDLTEEYLQGNEICRQMKKIFDEKYPEMKIFKSGCGSSCAHTKNSPLVNGVYRPCKDDDKFDWNTDSFLYSHTRDEMCYNRVPIPSRYYVGKKEITEAEYIKLKELV